MFLPLFHSLRSLGVPVSLTEWLTLLEALSKNLCQPNLGSFYHLARSLLVKDVAYYDAFDQAFAQAFRNTPLSDGGVTKEEIIEWLADPRSPLRLSPEDLARLKALSLEELLKELEDRLRRQHEPHHGGHHWIGSGGTSPFGIHGSHPTGISFGEADEHADGSGAGVLQAFERRYRNLRNDLTLDVRQISVALKRLRDLRESGNEEILDLEATVDETSRNGGEIDLVFTRERENQVRIVLAMDTGGSMKPFRELSERLFSAAHGINHFKDFRAFYFHNCIYANLYTDLETGEFIPTADVIHEYGKRYRLVIVGDASMAPFELLSPMGFLERRRTSNRKGIDWLRSLAEAFPKRAWLNPAAESSWGQHDTIATIGRYFPMFPLTLEGLGRAVKLLT